MDWTKTIGPGKAVAFRTVPISSRAYFASAKWFEEAWAFVEKERAVQERLLSGAVEL